MDLLQQEYVLVQAFKKTVSYIRSHNSFADILELDLATVNFPPFLKQLQQDIRKSSRWKSQKVRLVPAPKSGPWWINKDGKWEPRRDEKGDPTNAKLRPLAHVPLRDQVVSTALMICLADRIETLQGDPRLDVRKAANRKRVISYGNRLFCDTVKVDGKKQLRHRWGASKLYRSYYADYRTFISRPEIVAAGIGERSGTKVVIVQSDLSKFYDRVRPTLLFTKLKQHLEKDELPFQTFSKKVMNWKWDERDLASAQGMTDVEDFTSLALPQGLVSAGFFANIVLLDFDDELRDAFDKSIATGITLRDAARYVDDLRFVVEVPQSSDLKDVEKACHEWIEGKLKSTAPDLTSNGEKTRAVAVHDSQRVMVFQSRRMRRIQETVSGGFDANGGTQLLAALEGLFNTIGQFVETDENGTRWPLKAVPDVRDETVARFVAGRYRATFRSLRPLLEDEFIPPDGQTTDDEEPIDAISAVLTKDELDRQCQAFGLKLIEEWIRNAGSVRLLRVGLDLFPDPSVLGSVLDLLKPIINSPSNERGIRSAAEYCLSELFRAAAIETGLVPDRELLPTLVDLEQYRDVLRDYARELMASHWKSLSWLCQQQILLFVTSSSPVGFDFQSARDVKETVEYANFLGFLQGRAESNTDRWATHAVLARQSFLDPDAAARLIVPQLSKERVAALAKLAPSFAEELLIANNRLRRLADRAVLDLLSLPRKTPSSASSGITVPLVDEARRWNCRVRDELSLVTFAIHWLEHKEKTGDSMTPSTISVNVGTDGIDVNFGKPDSNPFFDAPDSFPFSDDWRFELGFLLRFVITGQSDPTESLRHPAWREREDCYRSPAWHWAVRRYSLYNGRDRLGPEWIPISTWMESFLTALLHWPGALHPPKPFQEMGSISKAIRLCRKRTKQLEAMPGEANDLLALSVTPRSLWNKKSPVTKPLRVCVAQLAVPEFRDGRVTNAFGPHDPECNAPATRHQYRRHLTAMLAGIDQMLRVRSTHRPGTGLDFLLLPELSVHPDDVRTRLLPFVRKHRCWVFVGLTYHRCHSDGPLVNSGLWIVPESSPSGGILHKFYEQGKQHLAPEERSAFAGIVEGHRPCQWLLKWRWSANKADRPLKLSGSICYDATDLALAAS